MDNALSVLGPQLVRGKPVKLGKAKKAALAAWSVKFALMLQLIYPRHSRFVIPEADYSQFYADRQPGDLAQLWAGYMEPPGKYGGPLATIRFGHCVIGLLKAGNAELLSLQALASPRQWVQIWPAIGTSRWPPPDRLVTGRLTPIEVGIRRGQFPRVSHP